MQSWWTIRIITKGRGDPGVQEATMRMHNPPHPGRIIKEAIEAIPMSITGFAAHIGVSRVALSRVLNERAGVTAEMSIKLSEAFGQNSPDLWFNLQNDYDFWQALQARQGRAKVAPLQSAAA
jgi:addiction module HigA family antidote